LLFWTFGVLFPKPAWKVKGAVEFSKKYDSNILLPDSVTGEKSMITELHFHPELIMQINRKNITSLRISLWSQEIPDFNSESILGWNTLLKYRHYRSHKLMLGADGRAEQTFSDNIYYKTSHQNIKLVTGYYWNARLFSQLGYSLGRQTFPEIFISYLSAGDIEEGNYYDYIKNRVGLVTNYSINRKAKAEIYGNAEYRDYYDDLYPEDVFTRVDETREISYYIAGNPPVPVYVTTYDTVVTRIPNIRQKDMLLDGGAGIRLILLKNFWLKIIGSGKYNNSNDPYYYYTYYSGTVMLGGSWKYVSPSIFYQYYYKDYSKRILENSETQLDKNHYISLSIKHKIIKRLSAEYGYYYRLVESNYEPDAFQKRLIALTLKFAY
jgi:hypothetical protein